VRGLVELGPSATRKKGRYPADYKYMQEKKLGTKTPEDERCWVRILDMGYWPVTVRDWGKNYRGDH